MSEQNLTLLQQANKSFREGRYKEALELYQQVKRGNPKLNLILDFNIEFVNKKLGKKNVDLITESSNKIEIHKPAIISDHFFNQIIESNAFDPDYYYKSYQGHIGSADNLLEHFLTTGLQKNWNPSPIFDTSHYLRANPDIAEAGVCPFEHFVYTGRNEGREAIPQPYLSAYGIAPVEYIPRLPINSEPPQKLVKPICFYLPQFHAIPENDKWWGKGFTEWTNVKPAKPQFDGHYQPHIPHDDIGYYNLLDRSVQAKQIELAKQYGIEGFCYYLYWFSGQRLLEQPLDNMLNDPSLDFPFCVCWANENWSRRWDGKDQDLLMVQNYSDEDDLAFIENVSKYLKDPRYIRVNGKPVLLVYRPNLFPDMKATTKRWREWCRNNGIGEIYLVYPQSFEAVNPYEYDFDAACEFPPNNSQPPKIINQVENLNDDFGGMVYDWRVFLERSDAYDKKDYKFFRSATPSWDNTARKKNKGMIFHNSCPQLFTKNLVNVFSETIRQHDNSDERLTFINAWNEWAEGAHLEPDNRYGYAWLQAVKDSHEYINRAAQKKIAIVVHAFYPEILDEVLSDINWIKDTNSKVYITTPHEKLMVMEEVVSKYNYSINIYPFTNHGRDVLPFLKVIPKVIEDGNEYLIKVHTKKSLHRDDGDKWRQEIYGQLLSMGMLVRAVNMFENNKKLAMISPDGNMVPISYYWGSNEKNVLKLCEKYGVKFDKSADYQFVAGTMFYGRVSLFESLLDAALIHEDEFDVEDGQVDGTLAHAYERFFGIYSQAFGMTLRDFKVKDKEFVFAERTA